MEKFSLQSVFFKLLYEIVVMALEETFSQLNL